MYTHDGPKLETFSDLEFDVKVNWSSFDNMVVSPQSTESNVLTFNMRTADEYTMVAPCRQNTLQ